MKKQLLLLSILGILAFPISLLGKNAHSTTNKSKTIKGVVVDELNEGVPGFFVKVKGSYLSTLTDANGKFKLTVPENIDSIMVKSYDGEEQTFYITNDSCVLKLKYENKNFNSSEKDLNSEKIVSDEKLITINSRQHIRNKNLSDRNFIKIGREYIYVPQLFVGDFPNYNKNKEYNRTIEIVNLNGKTHFFEVDKEPFYKVDTETFNLDGLVYYELIYHLPNKNDTSCVIANDVNIYLNHKVNNKLELISKTNSLGRYSIFVDSYVYDRIVFIGSDSAKTSINIKNLYPIRRNIPIFNPPLYIDIIDPLSKDSILLKKSYNQNSLTKEIPQDVIIGVRAAKPAIYLYPTKTDTISIKLDFRGTLGTTYPKYTGEWKVLATPNGELTNLSDNRKYNYLFWEGTYDFPISHFDYKSGFVVAKNDLDKFLIEKLSLIGLNNTEVNDFVVYWLPMLEKNEYNLIHFFINDNIDGSAFMNVKPKPDSEIRLFMEFKAVDKNYKITPQQLPSIPRKGFTLVEWGGGIIGDGKIQ